MNVSDPFYGDKQQRENSEPYLDRFGPSFLGRDRVDSPC